MSQDYRNRYEVVAEKHGVDSIQTSWSISNEWSIIRNETMLVGERVTRDEERVLRWLWTVMKLWRLN